MRVASFNLLQYLAPGNYWYGMGEENTYSPGEWQQKQSFVGEQLLAMDADVVGFQELFDPAALQAQCAAVGYAHFAVVETPMAQPNSKIFDRPVVAIASRFPIKETVALAPDASVISNLNLPADFHFARKPVCADVVTPEFGEVTFVVAHLKSKRPGFDHVKYAPDVPWSDWILDAMRLSAQGQVESLLRRGAEAAALYFGITAILAARNNHPVIVLGDLNDAEGSQPMEVLTMRDGTVEAGGTHIKNWPDGAKTNVFRYQMADAWNLAANPSGMARPLTHFHRGQGGVLDYVLVSNAFNERNRQAIGRVQFYDVLNRHLFDDGMFNKCQSDHGQVVAEVVKI